MKLQDWQWRKVLRGRIAALMGVVALVLCACGKQHSPAAAGYQPANDPDPERSAENELRQLLTQVNAQEGNVMAMARAATGGLGATPDRGNYYAADKYLESLRAAEAAITNKMAALAMERAMLANSKETNAVAAVQQIIVQTNRAVPDERAEEMRLKGRLMELQSLNEELQITMPGAGQVSSPTEEKAALAREDMYSAEDYVARLQGTIDLLQKKLQALEAEAAYYDRQLNSTNEAGKR